MLSLLDLLTIVVDIGNGVDGAKQIKDGFVDGQLSLYRVFILLIIGLGISAVVWWISAKFIWRATA